MKNKVKILIENILKESAENEPNRPKIKLGPLWPDRADKKLRQIQKILSQEVIESDLDLAGEPIENLGNIKRVKGNLNLIFCKKLKELPVGLIVEGWLDLSGCVSLQSLPPDLKVGGHLWLVLCERDVINQGIKLTPDKTKVTY